MPRFLIGAFFVLASASALATHASPASAPAWPAVHAETKPWTRWWWLGNIADEKTLTAEMERYAAAGLGGLELTPIYGVRGYEDRFVPYLSPRWMQLFQHTLAEARRLHLGLDLANGTGWPFGGPWLTERDTAHYLAHRTFHVAAGTSLAEPVAFTQQPVLHLAGPRRVQLAELKRPITANENLQDLALDQVRFEQPLPLVSLMAFPGRGEPVDLTSHVDPAGRLRWTAPADRGDWTLYALFSGPHGKRVERAAPGGEGFALDHFSSTALKNYLAHFDATLFARHLLSDKLPGGLRAFFNDSYEVDDAQGQSDWTPRFLAEFKKRRGYDLRTQLPALFAGADTRVLSDYRETLSDLLLDEFTIPWREWAHAHGALIRNQPHNSPANVLDLYAASDIPEQEGNGWAAMKLASSAAHLTGKPLASAETATWLDEHFLTTLAELKQNADAFLLSGLNHLCYHGNALSPPDAAWPGFNFYASVELNTRNPFWTDFAALNAYVTRAQSFLQLGRPDEDVLLYYNIHDRWAERGDGSLPHFGHGERDPVGVTAGALAPELRAAGVGFDYVSDRLLQNFNYRQDAMVTGAADPGLPSYHAIVLPAVTVMPVPTLAKLVELAERGATILVLDHLPQRAAGFRGDQKEFDRLLAKITTETTIANGVTTATVGRGRFLVAGTLAALLAHAPNLPRESLPALDLDYVRRRTDAGVFYFVVNRTDRAIDAWVPFAATGAQPVIYDPMTGAIGTAATRDRRVYLQLEPAASCIVRFDTAATASPWPYWQPADTPRPLAGEWSLTFTNGGPTLPPARKLTELTSWTELGGADLKAFSGTAAYTLTFAVPHPSTLPAAWQLDLGRVCDSAQVSLNGRDLGTLLQPPWRIVIPADALRAENTLEIAVTNLAANRIADLDRRGVPWKIFYNANMPARFRENSGPDHQFTAAHWKPRHSGLLGPVTLTPLKILNP
jgi:hypothetical protein